MGRKDIPTNKGNFITSVGAIYALNKFIFIAGNYIGYSNSSNDIHPFITSPCANIKSAFYVLNQFYK